MMKTATYLNAYLSCFLMPRFLETRTKRQRHKFMVVLAHRLAEEVKLRDELARVEAKSEERKIALLEAYHIINEHGTPVMRAHATLMGNIRKALKD